MGLSISSTNGFKLAVSLYNLTILHSTLYLSVVCVGNQQLCVISLSFVNTVQRCIILILVYKLIYYINVVYR